MNILFVDTETTGLTKDQAITFKNIDNWPTIRQIAWLVYTKDGDIVKARNYSIERMVIPESENNSDYVPPVIIPIHEILPFFLEDLKDCDVIVGHNIEFDVNVILSELYRFGLETDSLKDMQRFCTMKNSIEFCGFDTEHGDRFPKLQELYSKLFHKPFSNAHDAYCDIKATADCYWEMLSRRIIYIDCFPFLKTQFRFWCDTKNQCSDSSKCVWDFISKGGRFNKTIELSKAIEILKQVLKDNPGSEECIAGECIDYVFRMDEYGVPFKYAQMFLEFAYGLSSGQAQWLLCIKKADININEKINLLKEAILNGASDAYYDLNCIYNEMGEQKQAMIYAEKWLSFYDNIFKTSESINSAAFYCTANIYGSRRYLDVMVNGGVNINPDHERYRIISRLLHREIANIPYSCDYLKKEGDYEKICEVLWVEYNDYQHDLDYNQVIEWDNTKRKLICQIGQILDCYNQGFGLDKKEELEKAISRGVNLIISDSAYIEQWTDGYFFGKTYPYAHYCREICRFSNNIF